MRATAEAHPNIALVKYWGKRDVGLNLPSTSSLSFTLDTFLTRTTVTWGTSSDRVVLDGGDAAGGPRERVLRFLDLVDPLRPPCLVESESNFPVAAGLASSSSAFSALALAALAASGRSLGPSETSALARRGSGSACRSVEGGFVLWRRGEAPDGSDSHGIQLLRPDTWDLRIVVAVASSGQKKVGSREGMERTRLTSPCYPVFVEHNEVMVAAAMEAVHRRDLQELVSLMERSTLLMHATMLTALPSVRYWNPATMAILDEVDALKGEGIACGCTMDAGPNVKVLCRSEDAPAVATRLAPAAEAVHVLGQGGAARVVEAW